MSQPAGNPTLRSRWRAALEAAIESERRAAHAQKHDAAVRARLLLAAVGQERSISEHYAEFRAIAGPLVPQLERLSDWLARHRVVRQAMLDAAAAVPNAGSLRTIAGLGARLDALLDIEVAVTGTDDRASDDRASDDRASDDRASDDRELRAIDESRARVKALIAALKSPSPLPLFDRPGRYATIDDAVLNALSVLLKDGGYSYQEIAHVLDDGEPGSVEQRRKRAENHVAAGRRGPIE